MADYSAKQALTTMRLIHFAMMGGLVMFGMVVFYLNTTAELSSSIENGYILLIVAGAFTLMAVGISPIIFKQQLAKLTGSEELRAKMAAFQTAHIIRCALLEGAGLFATVISLVTRDSIGLAALVIVVGVFVLHIPSALSLERDLNLSPDEKNQLV